VPTDIDKRRQEIKEKILRKSMAKSNIYLGIALIVVVFAFLLLSNIPYEKQNVEEKSNSKMTENTSSKETVSSKTEAQSQEKKETEYTEAENKPPIPEDFDESKLVKISIVDDSQSFFWSNLYPTSVYFDESLDRISGKDSLKVEFIRERPGGVFADKVFNELQDWSNVKFISFWFKGNDTGLIFDVYIYFDKKWSNWVCLRFQDVYKGWVRFVFSTEKNIIKNGEIDWSKIWRIRIANNNKKFTGVFYFDDFAIWVPKDVYMANETTTEEKEGKTYGLGDTIIEGDLAVTLNRWYPICTVKSYVGNKVIEMSYSRVDITVKNLGDKEIYISYTPYKPVLIDDDGKIYEYVNVKVRRPDGLVVEHPDQFKLGVLYPSTSRSGAVFFYPVVTSHTDKVRLMIHLAGKKFEFIWNWNRIG